MVRLVHLATRAAFAVLALYLMMQALDFRQQRVPEPQEIVSAAQRQQELNCLANNIYWEAATEPFEGKVAVAQVTINRMNSGRFPNSVCGVVYQKNVVYARVICQFSWYCEGNHRARKPVEQYYTESMNVAKMVLLEGYRLPSLGKALYYHADYVTPGWHKPRLVKIGRHIFYGEDHG